MLLVFQSFGVSVEATKTMLTAIEEMKYFLRTAYGDSKSFRGSQIQIKFQGLCQGNGAAPAGWAVVSIVILDAHKRKGHGAKIVCPITNLCHHLATILFVNDTDILHLIMDADESAFEAHRAMQASVSSWGRLLIASGGSFKPSKCFHYLVSFDWNPRTGK